MRMMLCAAAALMLAAAVTRPATAAPITRTRVVVADTGGCPQIVAEAVTSGKKIFQGRGNCYTCHGADAKGTPLAPDLTDKTWLQIDGSYEAIVALVHKGVPTPKQHPAPMPPLGGAKLSDADVCAVGAYVFSLSHKTAAAVEK